MKPRIRTHATWPLLALALLLPRYAQAQTYPRMILNNNSAAPWTLILAGSPTGKLEVEKASGKNVGKLMSAGQSATLVKAEDFKWTFTPVSGKVSMDFKLQDKARNEVTFTVVSADGRTLRFDRISANAGSAVLFATSPEPRIVISKDTVK